MGNRKQTRNAEVAKVPALTKLTSIVADADPDPDMFAKIRLRQRIIILLVAQLISLLASSHQIYVELPKTHITAIAMTTTTSFHILTTFTPHVVKSKNITNAAIPANSDIDGNGNYKFLKVFRCHEITNASTKENQCCNKTIWESLVEQVKIKLSNSSRNQKSYKHTRVPPGQGQGLPDSGQSQGVTLQSAVTIFALSVASIVITLTNYCTFINNRNPYLRKVVLNFVCFVGFIIQVINCSTFHSVIRGQAQRRREYFCDPITDNLNDGDNLNNDLDINGLVIVSAETGLGNLNLSNSSFNSNSSSTGSTSKTTHRLAKLSDNLLLTCLEQLNYYQNQQQEPVSHESQEQEENEKRCPSLLPLYTMWSFMIFTTVLIPFVIVYSCKWRDRIFSRLIDDITFRRKGTLFSSQRAMIQQLKLDLEIQIDFDRRTLDQLQECLLEEYELLKSLQNNCQSDNNKNMEVSTKVEVELDVNGNATEVDVDENIKKGKSVENKTNAKGSTTSLSPPMAASTEFESYKEKLNDYNDQMSAYMNKAEAFQKLRTLDLRFLDEYARFVNLSRIKSNRKKQPQPLRNQNNLMDENLDQNQHQQRS